MSRQTSASEIELSSEPTAIFGVGGVTQHRLDRELDITSVEEVGNASVEELQEVWGVGQFRAGQMKGRAQGVINAHEARVEADHEQAVHAKALREYDLKQQREEVFGSSTGSKTRKVAFVGFSHTQWDEDRGWGGSVSDELDPDEAKKKITKALAHAGIDPVEDNIALGWAVHESKPYIDENGGEYVEAFYEGLSGLRGGTFECKRFETKWDTYGAHPKKEAIDAVIERNQKMIEWADDIICYKPGDYEKHLEMDVNDVPNYKTRWHSPFHVEQEHETAEITDDDAQSSHRSKPEPLAQDDRDEEAEAEWEEVDAEVGAYDRSEFSAHKDEDQDADLHYTSDSVENRPEGEEFTDGHGQSSHRIKLDRNIAERDSIDEDTEYSEQNRDRAFEANGS